MEEFWIAISLSDINGISRHSKVVKSYEDAVNWCEMTMKNVNDKFFILKATHQIKRQIAPIEVVPLLPKKTITTTSDAPLFNEEPELQFLHETKPTTTSEF